MKRNFGEHYKGHLHMHGVKLRQIKTMSYCQTAKSQCVQYMFRDRVTMGEPDTLSPLCDISLNHIKKA